MNNANQFDAKAYDTIILNALDEVENIKRQALESTNLILNIPSIEASNSSMALETLTDVVKDKDDKVYTEKPSTDDIIQQDIIHLEPEHPEKAKVELGQKKQVVISESDKQADIDSKKTEQYHNPSFDELQKSVFEVENVLSAQARLNSENIKNSDAESDIVSSESNISETSTELKNNKNSDKKLNTIQTRQEKPKQPSVSNNKLEDNNELDSEDNPKNTLIIILAIFFGLPILSSMIYDFFL